MRVVSREWTEERNQKLLEWFKGDRQALEFLLLLSDITETWDDLIDRDRPVSEEEIHGAFMKALLILPMHPFYMKHFSYLFPIMNQAVNSWLDANDLVRRGNNGKRYAFVLRNMDIQIAQAIAYLVGGWEHMRQVSAEMWDYFGVKQDDYEEWVAEGSHELRE